MEHSILPATLAWLLIGSWCFWPASEGSVPSVFTVAPFNPTLTCLIQIWYSEHADVPTTVHSAGAWSVAGKPNVEFPVAEGRGAFPEHEGGIRVIGRTLSMPLLSGKFGGDSWTTSVFVMGCQPYVDCHHQSWGLSRDVGVSSGVSV